MICQHNLNPKIQAISVITQPANKGKEIQKQSTINNKMENWKREPGQKRMGTVRKEINHRNRPIPSTRKLP
jgi:hypothetical protein